MSLSAKRIAAITAGATLFTFIFWNEKLALNALLYDLFLVPALFCFAPAAFKNRTVLLLLAGHLICTADVVIHNTLLSKIGFCFTLLVTTAFIQYRHRSPWYAGGTVLLKLLFGISAIAKDLKSLPVSPHTQRKTNRGRIIRVAVFPLLLLLLFLAIYTAANAAFSDMYDSFMSSIQEFMNHFFEMISIPRVLFFILGFYITGVLLEYADKQYYSSRDLASDDILVRKKYTLKKGMLYALANIVMGRAATGPLALKTQNTIGILSLGLLNALLFLVNCTDLIYIWLRFEYSPDKPVYKMVHEGTELLIVSILAAMAILLFFFRGNLNFYKRNKWLKYGAYAWIFQNTFLVLSVFMRDYYYIQSCGLAYKRIGVLFYLVMVLTGLVTMFFKIYRHKTTYHLMKVNAWAAIILLIASCCVHWDEAIVSYNIAHRNTISLDTWFLYSLSDSTLPLLDEHKAELAENSLYSDMLQNRVQYFKIKQQQYSWLSWNYADDHVLRYFSNKQPLASKQAHYLQTISVYRRYPGRQELYIRKNYPGKISGI